MVSEAFPSYSQRYGSEMASPWRTSTTGSTRVGGYDIMEEWEVKTS